MATEMQRQLLRDVVLDITALRDPDLILRGLIRRLRSAVGCDLAYLSLNDAQTGYTEIRFAEGIQTPEYAEIRMPIGTGVLGMAAAGVTTESPDYLGDVAKFHIPSVDATVNSEGVRAILGTPLRVGGDVLGALMIANRTAGAFSDHQRALLEEAALIGSIAVDVYNLRRQVDNQQRSFDDEVTQLKSASASESLQLGLSRQLATALGTGRGTTELLAIASAAVGGTVRIVDPGANTSSSAHAIVVPLDAGVIIEIESEDAARVAHLTPTVGTFLSIALLYESAIEDARHLRESELVERLVDPPPELAGRALRTGLAGVGTLDVVVLEFRDTPIRRVALNTLRNGLGKDAIAAARRGDLVVITRSSPANIAKLADLVAPFAYFGGVSTARDDAGIAAAFSEASLIARSMRILRRPGELAARASLGIVAFAIGDSPGSAERYVSSHLGPLMGGLSRDDKLLATALAYLDSHGSVASVAAELAVHENTVRQRLERLDALLHGWRTGPRSLDIHVALRTHALLKAHAAPAGAH